MLSRRLLLGRRFKSSSAAAVRTESSSHHDAPATNAFPHLFSPLDLGPDIGALPNRALMGSMHTGLEGLSMPGWLHRIMSTDKDDDDQSLDRLAAYFAERAQGGVGLMVTGGISPNMAGWTGPFSSQLTNNRERDLHRVVTDAVHAVEVPVGYSEDETVPARICMQILHTGRYAYHPMAVSASATKSPISPFSARSLSYTGVQQTCRDFIQTAVLAKEAGYDGVEVMGSEGYLLSQFLSPRTNHRTDAYGGSLDNRARLPLEIVRGIRQAVGKDFIIIFRLSLLDLVEHGLLFEESLALAAQLEQAGTTLLNTGIGWHEARVPTISTTVPRASFAFPTKKLKESGVVSIPIVATNRINHPGTAEDVLGSGGADMISMARPFLADPDLVKKSRENRLDEINTCIACNQACLDHVFQGKVASCLVNPRACHETQLVHPSKALLPESQRLPLKVVGAGPAGCAFAIAAAQRGHAVTLYEAGDAVGGQFHMAKRVPGKEEFHETLRYLRTQLDKHGVDIRLQTRVSYDDMLQTTDSTKWVLATGVHPRNPKIPGQDEATNVLSYLDVLKHNKPVGKRVAIIGAGGIGFDVAEFLLHQHSGGGDKHADDVDVDAFYQEWGIDTSLASRGGLTKAQPVPADREILLCQRKKGKVGANLGKTTGWIHRATLKQSGGVQFLEGLQYDKIDPSTGFLHVTTGNKKQEILQVDHIIICAGQVENRELMQQDTTQKDEEEALKRRVYFIGGAQEAGELDAKRAMDMGTRLAERIHLDTTVPGQHVFAAPEGVEARFFQMLKRYVM